MDPRHPELAVKRIRELMSQYDKIEHDMQHAETSAKLAQLEREGGLVVQEICLVAPRIHESMMQTSRQRRHEISHGNIVGPTAQIIAINEAITEEAEIVEKPVEEPVVIEKLVETELDKEVDEILKPLEEPKKKTTRKKKTAKKADK